jgi:hypothetical protein
MNHGLLSPNKTKILTGVLALDLAFLWLSLAYHDILIIFYSSGLWLENEFGLVWATSRSVLLLTGHHFRYPKLVIFLLCLELIAGVFISITDIWVYLVTDCECLLQIDGAMIRLVARSAVLTAVIRLIR